VKVKVLSIHWGFSFGGVARYASSTYNLGKYAPIKLITLCIINPNWACDYSSLLKLNAQLIHIKSRFDFRWLPRVCRVIRTVQPDLVLTHGFNGYFVALAVSKIGGLPLKFVSSYHGKYYAPSKSKKIFEYFFNTFSEYFLRRKALGVATVSEYSKKYLVSKRIKSDKISVIYNGIDAHVKANAEAKHRLRKEWDVSNEEIALGVVSRLEPIKGISYIVKAFAEVLKHNIAVKLIIVGSGPDQLHLKYIASKLGINRKVVFTGNRDDIIDCLDAFDIFILPSLRENHSIALLEAMRSKKPIIATNVGGNTESVGHESEALIVKPADTEDLVNAILRLAEEPTSRLKLSDAAYRRYIRLFTSEICTQKSAQWLYYCSKRF
jgi:glycosyltransferase involved in cell wall biosynthesis